MSTATGEHGTAEEARSPHASAGGSGGRPRDPSRADAIREAALDLLAEKGYERVTIEAVAARAGAGKATVYRHWESKAELVIDALRDLKFSGPMADTGSLRGDVEQLCVDATDEDGQRTFAVMQGLASAITHDPALLAAFNERIVIPRRTAMAAMFARAVERGEMPAGKDVELLTSVIPALIIYRLLLGGELPEPAFARRIVEQLLLPAATSDAPTTRHDSGREGSAHGR